MRMKLLAILLQALAICSAENLSPSLTGEVLVFSEGEDHLQSTIVSIASGSHPSNRLSPPAVDASFTLSCSTCSPYRPHTHSSRTGRILVLTDNYVQVFAATNADEGTEANWTQNLILDADCSPLYMQALSTGSDRFIVVCTTPTSFGYQVISSSSGLFQLHSLQTPASDITDLIFDSYKPSHSHESDAFVYVKNGGLTFGTLFDGQAPLPVFLDDSSCRQNSVTAVYPLLKQVEDKFRFLMDCSHHETNAVLRYKVTLFLGNTFFPESLHLLPATLVTGTPISSPDSDYFVIVQNTSLAAVKTEMTELYRVHSFPYSLHEVSFTKSVVPTLAVVNPGHNHMLIRLDNFINGSNSSVIELRDTQAFCPNQSQCLPHNMATSTVFFTFTATTTNLTEGKESTMDFSLIIYDIALPSNPLVRIDNISVLPKMAFPREISLLSKFISTTTLMDVYQSTPVPSHTYTPSVLVSTKIQIDSIPLSTTVISSSNAIADRSSTSHRSSSTAVKPSPTPNDPNRDKKYTGRLSLSSTVTILLVVVFCVLTLLLMLVLVISFIFVTARKQAQKSGRHTINNRATSNRDEEKAIPLSLTPYSISAVNPTITTYGDGSVPVNTVSVPETTMSRSSSDQVLPPLTLDLKSSAHTQPGGDDSNSSGVSSAADTPTSGSGELPNTS